MRSADTIPRKARAAPRGPGWRPLLMIAAALLAWPARGSAWAQSSSQPPSLQPPVTEGPPRTAPNGPGPQPPPERMVPTTPAPGNNRGVIRPPANVDRGMTRRPPPTQQFPTPVIPPPAPPAGQVPR